MGDILEITVTSGEIATQVEEASLKVLLSRLEGKSVSNETYDAAKQGLNFVIKTRATQVARRAVDIQVARDVLKNDKEFVEFLQRKYPSALPERKRLKGTE
jgi:hypothetical protein